MINGCLSCNSSTSFSKSLSFRFYTPHYFDVHLLEIQIHYLQFLIRRCHFQIPLLDEQYPDPDLTLIAYSCTRTVFIPLGRKPTLTGKLLIYTKHPPPLFPTAWDLTETPWIAVICLQWTSGCFLPFFRFIRICYFISFFLSTLYYMNKVKFRKFS